MANRRRIKAEKVDKLPKVFYVIRWGWFDFPWVVLLAMTHANHWTHGKIFIAEGLVTYCLAALPIFLVVKEQVRFRQWGIKNHPGWIHVCAWVGTVVLFSVLESLNIGYSMPPHVIKLTIFVVSAYVGGGIMNGKLTAMFAQR
ncbi:hypothetical protein ACFL0L_00895 [Patescibacteria group bacterium]